MYGLRGIDSSTPCASIVALANAGVPPPAVGMVNSPFGVPIPDPDAVTALARWTACTQGQLVTPAGFTDCGNGVFVGSGASCPAPPTPPPASPPAASAPAPVVATQPLIVAPLLPVNQCFRLFGGWEDCVGPIGRGTLFLGLGVLGLLWLFRGKR